MKKILSFIFLMVIAFVLTSCTQAGEPTVNNHEHSYATMYSCDEEYHWYQAICEHVNEVREKEKHEWNSGVITLEPTTETEGTKVYTCTVCYYEKTVVLDKVGSDHTHTYSNKWSKDDIYHWHAATCGHDIYQDKAEHNWNVTTTATLITYTCTVCGGTKTETVEQEDIVPTSTITSKLQYIDIEIGETYNISSLLSEFSGMTLSMDDTTLASYSSGVFTGKKEGVTKVTLKRNGKEQVVRLEVHAKGDLATSFTFDEYRLSGKKIVAFGDSCTANSTVGGEDTYFNMFAEYYNMIDGGNYAIGGTTATYGYVGSNIHKEYAGTTFYGGPQRIVEVYKQNLLDDVDYVIISYVGNDRYFQAPIDDPNAPAYNLNLNKNVNVEDASLYASAHSFKGSYRHMVNTLRQINPNIRIIVANYHYSYFDINNYSRYGTEYTVEDYRTAVREVADELGVKYINQYQHIKNYFDYGLNGNGTCKYFSDSVHYTVEGHKILLDYYVNGEANWYLVGSQNNWKNDIDWQFARYNNSATFYEYFNAGETFKLQSADGKTVIDGNNSAINSVSGLTKDSNGNIKVTESGYYSFVVNLSNNGLTAKREYPDMSYSILIDSDGDGFIAWNEVTTTSVAYNQSTGKYSFEFTLKCWQSVVFFYDGRNMTPTNTNISGSYNSSGTSDSSTKLYLESEFIYYSSHGHGGTKSDVTYKCTYDPKTDTLDIGVKSVASLSSMNGFVLTGKHQATGTYNSSTGTYTITVSTYAWDVFEFYYNGVLLTTANTTFDYSSTNLYMENKNLYHATAGTTITFTYNPNTNKLTAK